ncbi:MAG: 2-dehydro-3-deoxy-6-phosphogalactonate aldolase [Erythrobacter sp.]
MTLHTALAKCPIMAILRGVRPNEVAAIGEVLFAAGIRAIEIPLSSNEALASIEVLSRSAIGPMVIGAGTVLTVEAAKACAEAGAQFAVSPNTNSAVIAASRSSGMDSVPGYFTPTEAFAAIEAGATMLKLFPADLAGPGSVSALRAVLPSGMMIVATGGITPQSMAAWQGQANLAFGVGGGLYRPGWGAAQVAAHASEFVGSLGHLAGDHT